MKRRAQFPVLDALRFLRRSGHLGGQRAERAQGDVTRHTFSLQPSVQCGEWRANRSNYGTYPMNYRSILAVTDLSATGDQAVQRAALLASNCRAELRLMYAPVSDQLDCPDYEVRLREQARKLSNGAVVSVKPVPRYAASTADVAAEASSADLLVTASRRESKVADFFRGQWHQRVMRQSLCPVLVTRSNGQLPYKKIVVAVDFNESARQLVQLACALDDRATIELFHAISRSDEAKLRSADVPWEIVKAFRARQEAHARRRLRELAQSVDAGDQAFTLSTGSGDAARQTSLYQQSSGADLIVVGIRRRSAALELLCGTVSGNVFAQSSADLLIVPHDHQSSSRAAARLRIAAEQADGRSAFLSRRKTTL